MVVLDTSSLIFWTLDPGRLSKTAEQAISQADRVGVSSISIWEIGIKVERGGLVLPLSGGEYLENLEQTSRVEILPVDLSTWIRNLQLDWNHRDPVDRTIVATASLHNSPLVTSDNVLRSFYEKAVW
ncbi:MAG: type II toxin-antitoxin system VapC family toxin [Gemmatimonadetes bacterium]|nr:type II toxin-antitoxin system VapC family toxin [Gemmatimonadota bacterium]MYG83996.1 type II toxin-antitoxin system VapC family toxin [Gemmatimonadota bacterium]MYJ88359.1 type II toxin-antitoxin system VapC family toxin [Gemmatimonadota bacterium]